MKKYYLNDKSTALFFIDVQEKLAPAIHEISSMKKPLLTLIKTAQVFKMPIYLTEQYPRGLGKTLDEYSDLLRDKSVKYWEKTCFSALLPEILDQIKEDGVDTIIVCGVESHICVFQTVRDLLKEGFTVHLAADAVGSRSLDNKNTALALMREMGAIITNSETIAYDLLKDSKSENFKVISDTLK